MPHNQPTPGAADPQPVGPFVLFANPTAEPSAPVRPSLGVVSTAPPADWTEAAREGASVPGVIHNLYPRDWRNLSEYADAGQTCGPCPACKATSRPGSAARPSPRGPLSYRFNSPRWRCHCCEARGDTVDLVAIERCGAPFAKLSAVERGIVRQWFERHKLIPSAPAPADPVEDAELSRAARSAALLITERRDPRALLAMRLFDVEPAVVAAITHWLDEGAPMLGGRVLGVL